MEPVNKRPANGIIMAVLCIVMFLLLCLFTALLVVRTGNVPRIVRNTDITGIFDDTDIGYYMEYQLHYLPFNNSSIWLANIEVFLRSDAVSNEVGIIAERYARALSAGNLDYYLTTDEILDILENLGPELNELFDHHMTQEDNVILADTLDDILDLESLTVGGIIEDLGIGTTIPYLLVSPYLLWGVGLICFGMLFIIFYYCRRKIANAFLIAGIPILLTGFIYLAGGIVLDTHPELLGGRLYNLARMAAGAAGILEDYGIVLSVAGALTVAVSFVLRGRVLFGSSTRRQNGELV